MVSFNRASIQENNITDLIIRDEDSISGLLSVVNKGNTEFYVQNDFIGNQIDQSENNWAQVFIQNSEQVFLDFINIDKVSTLGAYIS